VQDATPFFSTNKTIYVLLINAGILQQINPQLSFHCPVCCDRANAAAEDADAGNPLLATPDSPKVRSPDSACWQQRQHSGQFNLLT
jgi:hypothetical protein